MAFSVTFPTRHTDTYASTGYVHGGVLLGLTELAYAAFEEHAGISKSANIVAVQRKTRASYHAPLPWAEGATVTLTRSEAGDRGFVQEFEVSSAATGTKIASIVHDWVWLDTTTGRAVQIADDVRQRLMHVR